MVGISLCPEIGGAIKWVFSLSDGFDRVFPMERLQTFTPYELKLLLCGEQTPSWTREDVLNYTEPKYGYTRDR